MQHIVIDPGGALPRAGLAYVVPDSREAIEAAVEALIARLDAADGDMDLEEIDEREPDDDAKGDPSWTEWHTRGRHKGGTGLKGLNGWNVYEDDEEDDPSGQADEDGINTLLFLSRDGGAGCPISGDQEWNGDEGDYTDGI